MTELTDIAPLYPRRTAILLLDYQPGILGQFEHADALTARAAAAIATARRRGATVAYVRVAFTEADLEALPETFGMGARVRSAGAAATALHADSPLTQLDARVAPQQGDIVVRKVRVGAFSTTDLHERLRNLGIDTLVIAGVSTSGAVLSTVRDADDRDYRVLVLADACADRDPEVHRFLTERIFPRQAGVIEAADLEALFA